MLEMMGSRHLAPLGLYGQMREEKGKMLLLPSSKHAQGTPLRQSQSLRFPWANRELDFNEH